MKITIPKTELIKLQAHAIKGFPHEVVGILAGNRTRNEVHKTQALINERADTHNRYKVSPLLLMRAEQSLEQEEDKIR